MPQLEEQPCLCQDLALDKDRILLIRELLKEWDSVSFATRELSTADRFAIKRIVNSEDFKSLNMFYMNILIKKYKASLNERDFNACRKLVEFVTALQRWPKSLYSQYGSEGNNSENSEVGSSKNHDGFSENLKADGEEFI